MTNLSTILVWVEVVQKMIHILPSSTCINVIFICHITSILGLFSSRWIPNNDTVNMSKQSCTLKSSRCLLFNGQEAAFSCSDLEYVSYLSRLVNAEIRGVTWSRSLLHLELRPDILHKASLACQESHLRSCLSLNPRLLTFQNII